MGAKESKAAGNAKQVQKDIIQHVRKTVFQQQRTNKSPVSSSSPSSSAAAASDDIKRLGAQFLITSKINPDQFLKHTQINSNLITTIRKGIPGDFAKCLQSLKLTVNSKLDETQITPLHLAAILQSAAIIKYLLSSLDININSKTTTASSKSDWVYQETPLMLAIKSAMNSTECIQTITPFIQDKRCSIGLTDSIGSTALTIAIAKGYANIVSALIGNNRVRVYTANDLALAIKLAVIYEREDLVEIIINEMDGYSYNEFADLLECNPELNLLSSALENLKFDKESVADNATTTIATGFMNTISTTSKSLALKTTKDNAGHSLHIGNIVQVLDEQSVSKFNPRFNTEYDFIAEIACQKAFIQDIDKDGDIYIDVIGSANYAGHVNAKCVKYMEKGPTGILSDGQSVCVGYYVQVLSNIAQVKELAKGHGGWKQEMEGLCGKTGRVRKIDAAGDIFVHFSTGGRHCFNSKALVVSSASEVESKDLNGDWIKKGCFAKVTNSENEFNFLQAEIETDSGEHDESRYKKLLGKLVYLRKLRLFMQYTDAVVLLVNPTTGELLTNQTFNINPKCLIKTSSAPAMHGSLKQVRSKEGSASNDDMGYVSREGRSVSSISTSSEGNRYDTGASMMSNISTGSNSDALQIIERSELIMKTKLGEGGFGCVTAGTWKGTDCAIKQIRPIVLSEMDYENILKESRIQYGLKHPNIVQLYGISYDNDLWMVMQLINGMDLHSLLFKNNERVALPYKVRICLQTTNAISYLHGKGFIHNDIKPENIMVERKTGNVFVCDFGITRYLGSTDLRTFSQQYTSTFGGTLPYIAPECFQKDEVENRYLRPTFKSDVWALGAVFIELFTEKYLFPNDKALYSCKIMEDYSGVQQMLKLVPEFCRNTLMRSVDPSPGNRPSSDDLNKFFCQQHSK